MAGQSGNLGGNGLHNRSHRPRPWPFPPPSVAFSASVRGLIRGRPWAGPRPSVVGSATVCGPLGPRNPASTDAQRTTLRNLFTYLE
jgi:hypothetical protein